MVDAERVERLAVHPGLKIRITRQAQEFRRRPTRSERILWGALRERGLDGLKFRRQQPIGPFVVDFYCASERLVVEVDGCVHDTTQEYDAARQQSLERLGLRFVRLTAEQVETDLPDAIAAIRAVLCGAGGVHPSPLVGEGPGVGGIPPPAPASPPGTESPTPGTPLPLPEPTR